MIDRQLAPMRFPHADVFIETGSGGGLALNDVLQYDPPYGEIHSIDIDLKMIEGAMAFVEADPLVNFHLGSSSDVLPTIMNAAKRTVFWLDAHYSPNDGQTAPPTTGQCPLLAELAAINAVAWQHPPIIFIDDLPLFTLDSYEGTIYAGCDRAQFPTLAEIVDAMPVGWTSDLIDYDGRPRIIAMSAENHR